MKYEPISPLAMDLCVSALEEAVHRGLGPKFAYTLTVSPRMLVPARSLLKQLAADTRQNPFAPYVNLEVCEEFARFEWCISDGEKTYGSNPL